MVQSSSNYTYQLRDAGCSPHDEARHTLGKLAHTAVPGITQNLMAPANFLVIPSRKCRVDEEIEVFNAEKYFKGSDMELQRPHRVQGPRVLGFETSSGSSESSRNNQTVRVPSLPPKNYDTSSPKEKPKNDQRIFVRCPCSGKKSVLIGAGSHAKTGSVLNQAVLNEIPARGDGNWKLPPEIRLGSGRQESFSFPAVNLPDEQTPTVRCSTERPRFPHERLESSDDGEVGPRVSSNKRVSTRRVKTANPTLSDEDTSSNASSDLFELEIVSSHISSHLRHSSSTSCYTPSEASIRWSVWTAIEPLEADGSKRSIRSEPITSLMDPSPQGAVTNKLPGLLGCRGEKAVRVVARSSSAQLESSRVSRQPVSIPAFDL